ncbi:MAG: sigma-70 family RNA polymerase sigma factor [Gammaproteobacteria bacterium]|nr:sigma-70 family RNA polymerase sigma factor [Gammaproteobacteria bacterium]
MIESQEITQLLQLASSGDSGARNALFDSVYQELRTIARAHRRKWNGNDTLDTTALVHEAYLKLSGGSFADYQGRAHFFATASKAMRQVLMNYAERVAAAKRGENPMRVTLSGLALHDENTLEDLVHIDALLTKLENSNPRHCKVFECRVFGGMTVEETAIAANVSAATVKRDWALVSAWLFSEMNVSGERPTAASRQ